MNTLRPHVCLALLGLAVLAGCRAQSAAMHSVQSTVDVEQEHDAIWAAWHAEPSAEMQQSKRSLWEFHDRQHQEFARAARAYATAHPSDPRRYEMIVQAGYTGPSFITGFKPEFDDEPNERNLIRDEEARALFVKQQTALNEAVIEASDATDRQRGGAFFWNLVEARLLAKRQSTSLDLTPFRALTERVVAKFPDERALVVVEQYLNALREQSPADADAYESQLQSTPIAAAMRVAAEKRKLAKEADKEATRLRTQELAALAFTASDGRAVDVAKLRGKVVMIDFWATWCAPCNAEIPNVVAMHEKYHDAGFEIVGITLEQSVSKATSSAEERARKLAETKDKLRTFTAKHGMSWPQYFDGLGWENPFVVKYGIHAIPAIFLLDRSGALHMTEARGPDLDLEVQRLLGR